MSALKALRALGIAVLISTCSALNANNRNPKFRVIAFFTAKQDQAHISFVHEANRWFPEMAAKYNFSYDTTSNWQNLNSDFLAKYQVVVFLDTRPEDPAQRAAFKAYMEHGGAWMGFHFAGFALTTSTRSAYPADWDCLQACSTRAAKFLIRQCLQIAFRTIHLLPQYIRILKQDIRIGLTFCDSRLHRRRTF